ncbi:MAG: carboxypeptidase regulatory-like domain-containing protein, partial [Saprospiraceae bacterium]
QSGALKAAKKKMENLDYMGAIQAYNQILKKNEPAEAKINLADCYRKVSDVDNAEFWYGQVVRLPEAEPIHYLHYGHMLMRNNKCDMAIEWFQKYIEAYPDDVRGQHLLRACDFKDELLTKNAGIYEIENMPFNTGLDDFGPAYFGEGLVYASESGQNFPVKRLHCWTGNPFLELYHVERTEVDAPMCDYEYGDAEKFSSRLNSKYHDAAVSFAEDNSEIFFTRNNLLNGRARKDDEGIIRLKIYSAEGNGGSGAGTAWSNMESLPFNSDEYSVAHPALAPDGQFLYFASDMPGGFGGMDLYVSEKENERWGPPLNLGPTVNTEGHEVFPFYAKDNKLYFASDGQVGLGGLDLFFVEKKEAFNEWGEINNMGAPINSEDDDFGLIMNEERTCGYFTSDREGGKGDDDIYSFRRNAATVKLLVYDEKTKEPIEGAEVVSDCTGNTVFTDKEGIAYVDQKLNQCCNFAASKEEYNNNEQEACTTGLTPGEETIVEIPLNKSVDFQLSGIVTDLRSGQPIPDAEVVITDCNGEEEVIMTDASGFYATTNLVEDCCVSTSVTKSGYTTSSGSSKSDLCPTTETPKLTGNMTLDNFL